MNTVLDIALFVLAVIWWMWFARKMDGIHKETTRAAEALDAMNKRELQAAAKARAAEQARLDALQFDEGDTPR